MEVDIKNFFKEVALSWALKDLNRWSFENGDLGQREKGSKGMEVECPKLVLSFRVALFCSSHVCPKSYIPLKTERVNIYRASLVAQIVKTLPAMQETWVRSLNWEDPLEKGMATHSSILA